MKKYLYIFLSFYIVFFTTTSAYAATSIGGWTATDSLIADANTTINAVKGAGATGMRSVVTVAASAGNVGKHLIKGGGSVALAYAMVELADGALDWVLDPANNRVKYTIPATAPTNLSPTDVCDWKTGYIQYSQIKAKADQMCGTAKPSIIAMGPSGGGSVSYEASCTYSSTNVKGWCTPTGTPAQEKYIPIDTVAAKVAANAAAGHAPSQDVLKVVALEGFVAGEYDTALDAAAVADPTVTPVDPSVPFDPSSIIAAIESIKSIIDNAFSSLSAKINSLAVSIGVIDGKVDNIAAEQQRTMQVINDGMADVVAANNATGARVGDVVAAIEALEGNMLTGEVINAAIDKAIAAGHTDTASIVAAIEAIEGNTLDGQVINDAVDRVIANDNINSLSTQDVVSNSIDKAIEADKANTTAVTDAIDAQTDAMTTTDPITGETALKLPGFCSWASPVCTFIDWTKAQWLEFVVTFTALKDWLFEDSPANDKDNTVDTVTPPIVPAQVAINFVGSCPAPLTFSFQFYGQNYKPSVPFDPVCEVAILVNPIIKICATIAAAFIAAGIRQGAK